MEQAKKEFEKLKKKVGDNDIVCDNESCTAVNAYNDALDKAWQWFKLQLEEEHREQVLHKSYNKKNTLRLAKFMHEEYENMARLQGWETQEKCRVSFKALPEKNIKTMLGVAQQILKNFLPTLKNSKGGKR